MALRVNHVTRPAFGMDDRAMDTDSTAALLQPVDRGVFSTADLEGLPGPVVRYLSSVIAAGTPTSGAARITMRGHIKVGRWLPFTATEVLDPRHGFLWSARVAGGLIRGCDRYLAGAARIEWKLLGCVPLMRAAGPDVVRSAAGRAAGESVWVPTSTLPRHGVRWDVFDDTTLTAQFAVNAEPVAVNYRLDGDGRVRSVAFDRWGDPRRTGSYGWHPFGGELAQHRTFAGVTVPTVGRIGWHYGTDLWADGEFFRFTITKLEFPALDDRTGAR
jgi:hypothetical protein